MKFSKDQFNKTVFYFSYTIILIRWMFSYVYVIGDIFKVLGEIALVILALNFCIQAKAYTRKQFFILLIINLLAIIVTIYSKDSTLMQLVLLVCTAISIDFKKFIKYDVCVKLIFMFCVIGLYYLNLTDVYYMHRSDGTVRSSMGFSHPNTFGAFVLSIIVEYLFIKGNKLNLLDVFVAIIVAFVVQYFADSRSAMICILLMTIGAVLVKFDKLNFLEIKIVKFIIQNSFFIIAGISLLLGYLYMQGNEVAILLDDMFTTRIQFIAKFLEEYNIYAFGQEIEIIGTYLSKETGQSAWILDNAYTMILLRYGLVSFILIGCAINIYMKKAYTQNKYLIIAMLTFLSYAIMETNFYKIYINIFWIYLASVIYNNSLNKNEESENIKNKK